MFKSQFKNLHEAEQLFLEGKIELALSKVKQLEKENNLAKEEEIACKILRSNLLFEQGDFRNSLDLVEESLKTCQENEDQLLIIRCLLTKVRNYLQLKKFDDCDQLLEQVEELHKKYVQTEKNIAISNQQEAILLNYKGEVS
ncbi:MAG: hypothetical protein HZR80_04245 [Candidatus Heimdallarchaeota archaeon]